MSLFPLRRNNTACTPCPVARRSRPVRSIFRRFRRSCPAMCHTRGGSVLHTLVHRISSLQGTPKLLIDRHPRSKNICGIQILCQDDSHRLGPRKNNPLCHIDQASWAHMHHQRTLGLLHTHILPSRPRRMHSIHGNRYPQPGSVHLVGRNRNPVQDLGIDIVLLGSNVPHQIPCPQDIRT